jgi:RarD protein
MKLKGKSVRENLSRRQVLWLSATGAIMGINWILLFEAFEHTTVAVATLCYYMQPTIVILLSPLVFREKLSLKKALCAAVAVAGMILVSGVIGGSGPRGGSVTGILLALCAAVLYAAVIMMNKSQRIAGVNALQKTTVQLLSAGAVMIPWLLLSGGGPGAEWSPKVIVLVLTVGIVHTGIAYLLYFGSINGLRVQSIAILSYIDPVSALFFSALFLKEPLSLPGVIGAVMIIGSALVGEYEPSGRG